jgi:hypothetical protein
LLGHAHATGGITMKMNVHDLGLPTGLTVSRVKGWRTLILHRMVSAGEAHHDRTRRRWLEEA